MKIIRDLHSLKQYRSLMTANTTLGWVPTMGCLHQGHLSLLHTSVNENDCTILSVFTNPTQFNVVSDYENYPKTEQKDLTLAEKADVDVVFIPDETQMYPDHYQFRVTTTHPDSDIMEGKCRPGHFDGVLTIVMKLLLLIKPTRAYFGEKDYQQLTLVRELVSAFLMDTEIVACPTIRKSSGLPLSSRLQRLSQDETALADQVATIIHAHTEEKIIEHRLAQLGIEIEYIKKYNGRLFIAFKIGPVRFIDNTAIVNTQHAY